MSQMRDMGKLVYEQPGNEVDGSSHSKEGSKSVGEGRKGSKGEYALYIIHVLVHVSSEYQ
jgi:hypothetical protein